MNWCLGRLTIQLKDKINRLAIIFVLFSTVSYSQHVLFGEHDVKRPAIYLDAEGMVYPQMYIADEAMQQAGNLLVNWYNQHETYRDSLLDYFLINSKVFNPEICRQLSDSLAKQQLTDLLKFSGNRKPIFLVHGFRKAYQQENKDVSSVEEFQKCEDSLGNAFFPIEIYWDAYYDCCFSVDLKRNRAIFDLFEAAYQETPFIARTLSELWKNTKLSTIQVIGHSLGCKVVSEALLLPELQKPDKFFQVCLIAPACSDELFNESYLREKYPSNIQWLFLYNKHDFVLHKKDDKLGIIGPGVKAYGETSLGCNKHHELTKLRLNIFRQTTFRDFELLDCSDLGKKHSWRYYIAAGKIVKVRNWLGSFS